MTPRKGQTWYRVNDGTPVDVRFVDAHVKHVNGVGAVNIRTGHARYSTVALDWFLRNYRPKEEP